MSDCIFTTRPDPSSLLPAGMAPVVTYCMTHNRYGGCLPTATDGMPCTTVPDTAHILVALARIEAKLDQLLARPTPQDTKEG